ncbi:MAG: DUF4209 domain-containing protein [Bacteroidota bacterium]|nr:DUF4209 domain-containing protein [Bacteroidota bacterium]
MAYRNQTTDEREKQIAQWELECFMFQIAGAKVFSFSYSTGEKPGDVYDYPVLDEHQNTAFAYLKERVEITISPVLKARYNHLLWRAVKGIKNRTYAAKAVDAYLEILNSCLTANGIDEFNNDRSVSKKCEFLASAVAETKLKIPETVDIFRKFLLNVTSLKFYIKVSLLETMLKYTNVFKPEAFEDLLSVFNTESHISGTQKTDDFTMVNYYLPVAVKVASKLKSDIGIWHTKIGNCYERMGDSETDPERIWIKQQEYTLAIQHYRQAGNHISRQKAEEKYAAIKDEVTLPISVYNYSSEEITALNEIEEEIKEKTRKLLEQPADAVFEFLAKGKFLPPADTLKKTDSDKENGWMDAFTTVKFDINKNIESISAEGDNNGAGMLRYKYYIRHYVTTYLYYTLIPGIRSGKLTYKSLTQFLHTYTWIGAELTKKDLGGETIKYYWISLLAPSLQEYFLQMESSLLSESYKPNFMLAIDGLTIKFEGLFREFCTRIKVPSSTNNKGSMQELYIHQLIKHPTIIKCFSEDDRAFFEFLFTKDNRLNLLNNVAHCYFDYSDYSYKYFHLLLAALLKLAKYNFN